MKRQRYYFWSLIFASLLVYLWITLTVITSSYSHQEVVNNKKELMQENRRLSIEYANLTSPAKVEEYAKEHFGLDQPAEKQFRYIKR
ncbi:MAG TPA: cell division protein FtsL [bacterium]|nr:cell division protein FtsL [bacterium]